LLTHNASSFNRIVEELFKIKHSQQFYLTYPCFHNFSSVPSRKIVSRMDERVAFWIFIVEASGFFEEEIIEGSAVALMPDIAGNSPQLVFLNGPVVIQEV